MYRPLPAVAGACGEPARMRERRERGRRECRARRVQGCRLAAGCYIHGRQSARRETEMAASGGYGFGIVGCGMIAEFHGRAMQAMKRAHLVAVQDCSLASARRIGEMFGVPYYTDIRRFLEQPGLDIVTIATPSGAHLEPVLAAVKARKHVICEKPLEVTLARCDAMIRAAKRARVRLAGIFPSRFSPAFQAAKQALEAGRIGRPTLGLAYIPWYRTQEYYDSGGWRGTWKLDGGGALMNQSIHTIDLLQWLLGDVSEISAYAGRLAHQRIEVEDTAVAALRFKSGALGAIIGSTAAFPGHPRRVEIAGADGSIFIRDADIVTWEFRKAAKRDTRVRQRLGPKPIAGRGAGAADPRAISFVGHQKQFEDFVSALDTGSKVLVDGPEARKAVEIILAIYQSAHTGRSVRLPLKRTLPHRPFSGG